MLLEQKKARNHIADKKQQRRYRRVLGKETIPALAEFKDIKYTYQERWQTLKKEYAAKNRQIKKAAQNQ
jgi:hypothetical protein